MCVLRLIGRRGDTHTQCKFSLSKRGVGKSHIQYRTGKVQSPHANWHTESLATIPKTVNNSHLIQHCVGTSAENKVSIL